MLQTKHITSHSIPNDFANHPQLSGPVLADTYIHAHALNSTVGHGLNDRNIEHKNTSLINLLHFLIHHLGAVQKAYCMYKICATSRGIEIISQPS